MPHIAPKSCSQYSASAARAAHVASKARTAAVAHWLSSFDSFMQPIF